MVPSLSRKLGANVGGRSLRRVKVGYPAMGLVVGDCNTFCMFVEIAWQRENASLC